MAIRDWARQVERDASRELSFAREPEERMLARVLILQGQARKALDLLSPLLEAAESAGRMADAIMARALQALALHAIDDVDGALATLDEALQLAEPEGHLRAFVDEGPAMEKLLRQAATRGLALDYIHTLLEAFRQEPSPMPPAIVGPRPPAEPLPNPLTERELEVLRLIAAGLTNREIAEELVVVLGTVKAHINSIYRKIDVSNRVQAVSRARELQLL
jgi:LuxR family maltose regulon positive regulatory protein